MPRTVLIDELHVGLFVSRHLSAKESAAIRRTLRRPSFEQRLHRAVQEVMREIPTLAALAVKISR